MKTKRLKGILVNGWYILPIFPTNSRLHIDTLGTRGNTRSNRNIRIKHIDGLILNNSTSPLSRLCYCGNTGSRFQNQVLCCACACTKEFVTLISFVRLKMLLYIRLAACLPTIMLKKWLHSRRRPSEERSCRGVPLRVMSNTHDLSRIVSQENDSSKCDGPSCKDHSVYKKTTRFTRRGLVTTRFRKG